MANTGSNAFVAIALAAIAIAAVFFLTPYILQSTGAVTATTQTIIGNQAPSVGNCYITPSTLTLTAGPGTTRVWCNCTFTDTNGYTDIVAVNATIFNVTNGEGASGASGTASNLFRYNNQSCRTYNGA